MNKLISIFILAATLAAQAQSPLLRNDFTTNSFNALTYGARFVDAAFGNNSYSGTVGKPWATIYYAQTNAPTGSAIYVSPGTYPAELTRGDVVWYLARGAVLTNALRVVYPDTGTNIIIRGEGDLKSGGYTIQLGDGNGADIQARYIYGFAKSLEISTGVGRARLKISGAHIRGDLYAETFDQEPECLFLNCVLYGSDAGMTCDFSVSGSTSTANAANAKRTGSWVINTNLLTAPQ